MTDWIDIMSRFGFPVVVALWFMFRIEKIIKNQTRVMWDVKVAMEHVLARKVLIGKRDGKE